MGNKTKAGHREEKKMKWLWFAAPPLHDLQWGFLRTEMKASAVHRLKNKYSHHKNGLREEIKSRNRI
jgi:hypothetical protein